VGLLWREESGPEAQALPTECLGDEDCRVLWSPRGFQATRLDDVERLAGIRAEPQDHSTARLAR
jgi:hypothetical protein